MPYDRGERMKLTNALTAREKRQMASALANDQDAVEAAEDKRNERMAEYWDRGMAQAALQGVTGLGYETVRKILRDQGRDIDPA